MGLNLGTSGGNFLPYLKYNAKAGRFYKKEGENEVEVQSPNFLADFANIKTGWFLYVEGSAPSIVFDADLSTQAARPSEKHKRGFKLNIFSKTMFGEDGAGEFASASMHTCQSINDLYGVYETEQSKYPGKVPVVTAGQAVPQKDKMGTNYKPTFTISKWVDRPAEWETSSVGSGTVSNVTEMPKAKVVNEF